MARDILAKAAAWFANKDTLKPKRDFIIAKHLAEKLNQATTTVTRAVTYIPMARGAFYLTVVVDV
jgi:hypothetical protein